jgi:predicted NUDIX family NTP pyrophosphohydrolase
MELRVTDRLFKQWWISSNSTHPTSVSDQECTFKRTTLMPKQSAGLLAYRRHRGSLEVFLVHPGGPFWKSKDDGAWTIPKGEFAAGEEPLEAAKREFREETGFEPTVTFLPLLPCKQSGGKIVHAWAFEADYDPAALRSNTFTLQSPPESGKTIEVPEIDRADWFPLETARTKILPGQRSLLEQLEHLVCGL